MYLKRKICNLESKAQINKMEINKSAVGATKAQNELNITKCEAGRPSGVVANLRSRLDRLQHLTSDGRDRLPPLGSGSADSWRPRLGPSRPGAVSESLGATGCPPRVGSPDIVRGCPPGAAEMGSRKSV